jgi:CRP/FNR family cyclic AMP-dependent transcriptional regulator
MYRERLKSVPFFASMKKKELEALSRQTDELDVATGKELTRQGDFGQEFFVIESGTAEVTRNGEHVADLGPGDFFGEIGLLERALRNATVTATAEMRLITLTGWDMKRMEKAIPEAVEEVRRVIEERRPAAS